MDDTIPSAAIFYLNDKLIYRKDRNIRGGGVMITINADLQHRELILPGEK